MFEQSSSVSILWFLGKWAEKALVPRQIFVKILVFSQVLLSSKASSPNFRQVIFIFMRVTQKSPDTFKAALESKNSHTKNACITNIFFVFGGN